MKTLFKKGKDNAESSFIELPGASKLLYKVISGGNVLVLFLTYFSSAHLSFGMSTNKIVFDGKQGLKIDTPQK